MVALGKNRGVAARSTVPDQNIADLPVLVDRPIQIEPLPVRHCNGNANVTAYATTE